jgi:hypothetical protein
MIHIGDEALLQRFHQAQTFGSIRPGETCDGCARTGAGRARDLRGAALPLHACPGCQKRLTALRKAVEARRKNRGK